MLLEFNILRIDFFCVSGVFCWGVVHSGHETGLFSSEYCDSFWVSLRTFCHIQGEYGGAG